MLVSRISFFNLQTYKIILSDRMLIWRDVKEAHFFDLKNHEIIKAVPAFLAQPILKKMVSLQI